MLSFSLAATDQGNHAGHQVVAVQGAPEERAAQGDPDVGVVGAAAQERLLPHQQHELIQHREPSLKRWHAEWPRVKRDSVTSS